MDAILQHFYLFNKLGKRPWTWWHARTW